MQQQQQRESKLMESILFILLPFYLFSSFQDNKNNS